MHLPLWAENSKFWPKFFFFQNEFLSLFSTIWWRIFLVTGHSQTLNSHKLFCDDFKKLINIFVDVDSVVVLIVWKIFYSYPYISWKAKKCNLSHGTLRTHIFTTQILTSNFSEFVKVWNLKFGILHLRLLNNDFVKRNPQFS